MKSSELLNDLLTPGEEGAQAHLQTFFEVLPLALMEFLLQGVRLVLVAANAAARCMHGLGAVRGPGIDAAEVLDPLAGSGIAELQMVALGVETAGQLASLPYWIHASDPPRSP